MADGSRPWFHPNLGRMETERLLIDCSYDGSFLIRPSETMKGAYVLSLIQQNRIHHYRILPNEEGTLSVQAQQGVQQKRFGTLDELVSFYSQPRRGLVSRLTEPVGPRGGEPDEDEDDSDADYDDPDEEGDVGDLEVESPSKDKSTVVKFMLAHLTHVDLTGVDKDFEDKLRQYLSGDIMNDVQSMVSPRPHTNYLKLLLSKQVEATHKQLDKLQSQVEVLHTLIDMVGGTQKQGTGNGKGGKSRHTDFTYDSLQSRLSESITALKQLETSAFTTFKHLSSTMPGGNSNSLTQPAVFMGPSATENNEVSFDVKLDQNIAIGGKKNQCLTLSLRDGTLTLSKGGEQTTYQHHQVIQLIKSRSKEQKLGILFEGQNRRDYTFASMQAREHFCQLIQMIRNKLRTHQDPDSITIFVGTWNMGDAPAPSDISNWFRCEGWGRTLEKSIPLAHDIYVIGSQETGVNEKEWVNRLKSTLKQLMEVEYEKVALQALWGIRLTILVKSQHAQKISHLQHSQVRTGIGNTLGNKGGVGITFHFGNLSLAFINCHLTSGTEKCNRRNQNYHDILKGMATLKHKKLAQFDLTHQFHHLFFLGDLNYRVEMDSRTIIEHAKRGNCHDIICSDQLRAEMEKKKVFVGFEEAPILFPPTYRFKRGERTMNSYVYIKHKRKGDRINEPSFCDRVLWRSYPGTRITNTSYGCTNDILTSDHSPVFSTFQIGGVTQYVSDSAHDQSKVSVNTYIIIQRCLAKVQTNSKTQFYMEILSNCFEGVVKTVINTDLVEETDDLVRAEWSTGEHIVKRRPVITEQEYLEQQHLMIVLKSTESDEPSAECCIALTGTIGPKPQLVVRELIHQGHSVGEFECYLHVTMDQYKKQAPDPERDLYGNMAFLSFSDLESNLEFKGSRTRVRTQTGGSSNSITSRPLPNPNSDMDSRPPHPVPRSGSISSSPNHPITYRPPMPLPPANLQPSSAPSSLSQRSSTQSVITGPPPGSQRPPPQAGSGPPAVSQRPPPQSTSSVPSPISQRPPLPLPNRSGPPSEGFGTVESPVHPNPRRRDFQTMPPRPLGPMNIVSSTRPTVSPEPHPASPPPVPSRRVNPSHPQTRPNATDRLKPQPPVPRRARASPTAPQNNSQSLPNSVEELLSQNNLKKYIPHLVDNGFDDINFLQDITPQTLTNIGVTDVQDREKLLKIVRSLRS